MQTRMDRVGVIHGRFQVLHNDHLKYLLAGKALCRHLVVGITNPDPFVTRAEAADPKRSDALANPLTYYERQIMVSSALRDTGLDWEAFTIVPFPINRPERYRYYVPMDATFYLSIYDGWGRQKLNYFQSLGLNTHVLWEVQPHEKGISAGDIRHRIVTGQTWEDLVPRCVPALIEQWGLARRLKALRDQR